MESGTTFFTPCWRPRAAAALAAVACLLLASLLVPAGQAAWQAIDARVFYALNGTLADRPGAVTFWAWANYRPMDLVSASIMLVFLVFPGPAFAAPELRRALFGFFTLLFLGLIVRESLDTLAEWAGVVGPSPSLLLEPAYRLTELAPHIATKDSSSESFPGDHASVLMSWAGYLLIRRVGIGSLCAVGIAILLTLPRLVAGAHALSDVIVGGGFIALMTLALGYCTPWHGRASAWVTGKFDPLVDWFGRTIPGLSWFSFFRVAGNG